MVDVMSGSQFCFNVTIIGDNDHEGANREQVTLNPFSVSTPDLIEPPLPSVTILIEDNDGACLSNLHRIECYSCILNV